MKKVIGVLAVLACYAAAGLVTGEAQAEPLFPERVYYAQQGLLAPSYDRPVAGQVMPLRPTYRFNESYVTIQTSDGKQKVWTERSVERNGRVIHRTVTELGVRK